MPTLFSVKAITSCSHLGFFSTSEALISVLNATPSCSSCGSQEENWVCLFCCHVGCSHYQEGHGALHAQSSGHSIAIGLRDLSCWCYQCEAYLNVFLLPPLHPPFRALYRAKFGEDPKLPESKASGNVDGGISGDLISREIEAALRESSPGLSSLELVSRSASAALFTVATLEGTTMQVSLSLTSGASTVDCVPETHADSLHSLFMAVSQRYGAWYLETVTERLLRGRRKDSEGGGGEV